MTAPTEAATPEFVCPGCPQQFQSREQWRAHTRNHAHARNGWRSRADVREEMRQEQRAS